MPQHATPSAGVPLDVEQDRPYDAHEVHGQASALAAHLLRSGIRFLPKPDAGETERWINHFAKATVDQATVVQATVVQSPAERATAGAESPPVPHPTAYSLNPTHKPLRRIDPVPTFRSTAGTYPGDSLPVVERQAKLDDLAEQVAGCTRCEVLARCRTQTVFGEGNVAARFVFFGDAPGTEEDRSGRPFADEGGRLLTKMIQACRFDRQDAYLMNSIKCRPPGNRSPEADEFENCRTFYEQQLSVLKPEYIVCLGTISAQQLLKTKLSVGRLRGKLHEYLDSKVMVTYHPTYLLRNPAAKKAAWDDLQMMLKDAGLL